MVLSLPLHSLVALASTCSSDQLCTALDLLNPGTVLDTSTGVQGMLLLYTKIFFWRSRAVAHAVCCKPEASPMTVTEELIASATKFEEAFTTNAELAGLSKKASTEPLHRFLAWSEELGDN